MINFKSIHLTRLDIKNHRTYPSGKSGCGYNKYGICNPFKTRLHVQLCKVDAAGYQWKTGDYKEHGADVTRLHAFVGIYDIADAQQRQHVDHTGCCNRKYKIGKKGNLSVNKKASEEVTEAGSEEGTDHFHGTASQKEGESAAGKA